MKEKNKNWLNNNWFKIVAILFLWGALADNPYVYYQFLRWFIFGVGGYSTYLAYNSEKREEIKKIEVGIFGVITLLFNPIIPFHFQRAVWQIIDFIVASIFFTSLFVE